MKSYGEIPYRGKVNMLPDYSVIARQHCMSHSVWAGNWNAGGLFMCDIQIKNETTSENRGLAQTLIIMLDVSLFNLTMK